MNARIHNKPTDTTDIVQPDQNDEYSARAERVRQIMAEEARIKCEERKAKKRQREQRRFDELMAKQEAAENPMTPEEIELALMAFEDERTESLRMLLPKNIPGTIEHRIWNAFAMDKKANAIEPVMENGI